MSLAIVSTIIIGNISHQFVFAICKMSIDLLLFLFVLFSVLNQSQIKKTAHYEERGSRYRDIYETSHGRL